MNCVFFWPSSRAGLRAGWYAGNYQCSGANSRKPSQAPWDMPRLVQGHVDAIKAYGFDSVKCDSGELADPACGPLRVLHCRRRCMRTRGVSKSV